MQNNDRLSAENDVLRRRLSELTGAILRISEDLDLDVVLQEVVDGARSLTGARYGAITTLDDHGKIQEQEVVLSGLSAEQTEALYDYPMGRELFEYVSNLKDPLRTSNFADHVESAGFAGLGVEIGAYLGAQIRVQDRQVGTLFVCEKQDGTEFTREDEETVETFATQAAMAITNARRYGDQQQAKADLETLVNTSPVGVVVFDARSREVTMLNREARRIVGVRAGLGRDIARQFRMECRRMDGSPIAVEDLPTARAINAGETVQAEEMVVRHPDGKEISVLVNATPIRSEDGEVTSVVSTMQDITPLEDLERLRSQFLAMVSHELRAPLTSIKGAAATARDAFPFDPAEVRQFLQMIEEQADNMRDMISGLLDMSKIEAGTMSVSPKPADLGSVIEQARNAFHSSGHNHRIDVDIAANLPRVLADGQRITQVLLNLFSNAAAHSQEWSTIKVTAVLDGTNAAVSVADEGAGIAPERLPEIFSKFAPAGHEGSTRRASGYGLGLTICKGIVEAHSGRIQAHSQGEGRGARFTFTLPALDESTVEATDPDPGGSPGHGAPSRVERILVVDDDPHALRYVRNTLARVGYQVVATSDPDEVESLINAEAPHLVLLDLMFPSTDGFELMRRLPRILEAPVIVLSGRGDYQQVERAFEMGVSDYVVKPFSPTELLVRTAAALRRREQSQHTEPYRAADLTVDYITRRVTVAGREAKLTPTEYKLLSELCINAGRPLSYEQLLERIWDQGFGGDLQKVRTIVKDLRAKLGDDARNPTYILTVPGVGYRAATA